MKNKQKKPAKTSGSGKGRRYLPILSKCLIGLGHLTQTKTITLTPVSNEYGNEFVIVNVIGYL